MVKMKLHQFEKLFYTLTKQLHHITQGAAQLSIEMDLVRETIDVLKDQAIPSTFVDQLVD